MDGVEEALSLAGIYPLMFTPDGERVVYHAWEDGWYARKHCVVVGALRGQYYDWVESIAISPDSQHVAHRARRDGAETVVVDELPGVWYDYVVGEGLAFYDDGCLEYLAVEGDSVQRVKYTIKPPLPDGIIPELPNEPIRW